MPTSLMSSRSPISRRVFSLAAGALLTSLIAGAPARLDAQTTGPSLVVLVRHGEKAAEPAGDPPLSPAGQERAKALGEAMLGMQPSAIIVTATKRTTETASAVAAKSGLTPQVIALTGGGAAHIAAVVEAVKKASGVVLVVGHSNTIPAIVKALGGPAFPDICDASYANMFVLQPGMNGKPAQVVKAQYGAADAALPANCAPMVPK